MCLLSPSVAHIDPFLLVDEAQVSEGIALPFADHPHAGLVACSCLISGPASMAWDNHHGAYGPLRSGGMFQINAGRGVAHDEGTVATAEQVQTSLQAERKEEVSLEDAKEWMAQPNNVYPTHIMQVWFNPGIHHGLPRSEFVFVAPQDVPSFLTKDRAMCVRVLVGEYMGHTSPAKTWKAEVFVLNVQINAHSTGRLAIPAHMNGWLYTLTDAAAHANDAVVLTVNGEEMTPQDMLEFTSDEKASDASSVCLANNTDKPVRFFVGAGVPHHKPWYKLLGNDGAMVCSTEAECRAYMEAYELDKENFGKTRVTV
jgi:redox-sensitive bicupin YhaK (pirin superfamily)